MANLWDSLDQEQRQSIARQMMVGSKPNAENMNRAMEQLAQNPKLVERYAEDAGIEISDHELEDTQPNEDMDQDNENDIERNVNEALSNSADVQETGELTQDIPPPKRGESMQEYIDRLMFEQDEAGKASGEERLAYAVGEENQRNGEAFDETIEDLHYPADEKEGDKAERMRTRSAQELLDEDLVRRDMSREQGHRRRGPTGSYSEEYRRRTRSRPAGRETQRD